MEIALFLVAFGCFALLLFNTVLLIGIAGSLAKVIKSIRGEEITDDLQWARILKSRKALQMKQGNNASYADMQMAEPFPNWDGIPKADSRNWDGFPRTE